MSDFGLTWVWILAPPLRVVTWTNCWDFLSLPRWGCCNLPGNCSTDVLSREDQGNRPHSSCLTLTSRSGKRQDQINDQEVPQDPSENFQELPPTPNIHCSSIKTSMCFYSKYSEHAQMSKKKKKWSREEHLGSSEFNLSLVSPNMGEGASIYLIF